MILIAISIVVVVVIVPMFFCVYTYSLGDIFDQNIAY